MQNFHQVTVPAGEYYLGDPCYSVPEEFWGELLKSSDRFMTKNQGEANGFTVYAFHTAWGDGTYAGTDGSEYPVDAGLIGLVPVALGGKDCYKGRTDLFTVVVFTQETVCTSKDGLLSFGHISIDTDPDEEDDYYDGYDDYYEEEEDNADD
jgi:hypothetical protein